MIKIEINAENGADARKELIDLLGFNTAELKAYIGGTEMQIALDRTKAVVNELGKEGFTVTDGGTSAIEIVKEEETKKKRRTKAEIEAEKANTGSEEPPVTEVTPEPETPAAEVTYPDLPALQRACAVLVRAGYKDDGINLVKTIGGADSSKEVPEEKRQALIDALVKFAEDKQIAQ